MYSYTIFHYLADQRYQYSQLSHIKLTSHERSWCPSTNNSYGRIGNKMAFGTFHSKVYLCFFSMRVNKTCSAVLISSHHRKEKVLKLFFNFCFREKAFTTNQKESRSVAKILSFSTFKPTPQ